MLVAIGLLAIFKPHITPFASPVILALTRQPTVSDRVEQFGESAHSRLLPYFESAEVTYPPKSVVLVGLKQERRLELYAGGTRDGVRYIRSYPVIAASGSLGPKLRQGDLQVPEGLYGIELLNPNSSYHLSLRVSYPNEFDRKMGRRDSRSDLGDDIYIHGRAVSIGCLAMGDTVIEELFVLAAESGHRNVEVILSPVDFRISDLPPDIPDLPTWSEGLYQQIKNELTTLPLPSSH
jgi:murein L,D-transpeptidase YafK